MAWLLNCDLLFRFVIGRVFGASLSSLAMVTTCDIELVLILVKVSLSESKLQLS